MNAYDRVPYRSHPFVETHPDRLATVATLFRMRPAPVDSCRVLEIGCASGGNLIPMAETLPRSRFVGLDLSAGQIASGREIVSALSLPNIELRHGDLREVDESWGQFDYIIAHGVYSWVPDEVRAKLLDLVAARLSDNGVALVSHNVKPGWHLREMVRGMMLYHVANLDDPTERVAQARALVEFLVESTDDDRWRALLQTQLETIAGASHESIYHDWLADVNDAGWFCEFVAEAERRGLMFLADADFASMVPKGYSRAVADTLDRLGSGLVEHEQYHDFVRARTFRMTLLVRVTVDLDRHVEATRLRELHVASRARPNPVDGGRTFRAPRGAMIEVRDPKTRDVLVHLSSIWPAAVRPASLGDDTLLPDLLSLHAAGILELSVSAPRFTVDIPDFPHAPAFARLQASRDSIVTNLRHEIVKLAPARRSLLSLCDGTRHRSTLASSTPLDLAAVDTQLAALASQALLWKPF